MHTFYYADHSRHDPSQSGTVTLPDPYLEVPARIETIRSAIAAADLGPIISPGDFGYEALGEVHDYGMLNLLQNAHRFLQEDGKPPQVLPDTFSVRTRPNHVPRSLLGLLGYYSFDTYAPVLAQTWQAAYWAAQSAISAAALVLAGSDRVAYALCRPPGHHAAADLFGGYCYVNNAAVAANWLVQQGQRVAILDLDYHHGNGTQSIFYGRSDVLVCSIHADPLNEYPFYWGYADEYGEGAGRNYNFNYPLPRQTQADAYLKAVETTLIKVRLFVPDVLVLSMGFDTVEGDPNGSFRFDSAALQPVGARLRRLDVPTVVVQEGGYQLATLGASAVAFFAGLTGR